MSEIERLQDAYDYTPETHDYRAWWDHHRALIAAMEPAQWPTPGQVLFTDSEVAEIRDAYATGDVTQCELATLFGCSQSTINNIVNRNHWYETS